MRGIMRIVGLSLAFVFLFLILVPPVTAGQRTTGVWEGIAIGLGAGFVLSAISQPPVVYYQPAPPPVAYYEPIPLPVVYAYPPKPAVVALRAPHYSVYGPPYGRAHGHWKSGWKKAHRWHDD